MLSLVIPCFNEGENIPILINKLKKVFKDNKHEVIIVNNGSTDQTKNLIEDLIPNNSNIRVVHILENIGYGNGIIKGLEIAKGEVLGWTHADLQTNPVDALKGLKHFENKEKKIFVKGLRTGRSLQDKSFTFFMSLFELFILGKYMRDINAQPTLFSRSLLENWKNPPLDFSLDLYAYYFALKNNYRISRFRVKFPERIYGISKWNYSLTSKIKFIKRTIKFSMELRERLKK